MASVTNRHGNNGTFDESNLIYLHFCKGTEQVGVVFSIFTATVASIPTRSPLDSQLVETWPQIVRPFQPAYLDTIISAGTKACIRVKNIYVLPIRNDLLLKSFTATRVLWPHQKSPQKQDPLQLILDCSPISRYSSQDRKLILSLIHTTDKTINGYNVLSETITLKVAHSAGSRKIWKKTMRLSSDFECWYEYFGNDVQQILRDRSYCRGKIWEVHCMLKPRPDPAQLTLLCAFEMMTRTRKRRPTPTLKLAVEITTDSLTGTSVSDNHYSSVLERILRSGATILDNYCCCYQQTIDTEETQISERFSNSMADPCPHNAELTYGRSSDGFEDFQPTEFRLHQERDGR